MSAELLALLGLAIPAWTACGSEPSPEPSSEPSPGAAAEMPYDGPPLPWDYRPFPSVEDVTPEANPSTEAKVELGRLLFYDPILSRDRKVACATCHSEIWGMSDGLPVSVGLFGVGPVGPGREGPHVTRRNAQALWNVAFREGLFWDGRESSLEAQALLPIENDDEMGRSLAALIVELRTIDEYVALFDAAFPEAEESVTAAQLAQALAAFQRTMVTDWAPYDRYVAGDEGALREDVKEGMFLFGEAGCATCHVPPLFESEIYANRGASNADPTDRGRAEVTGVASDEGAFRVPTLRNLRETGPYFHGGAVETLEEAVEHEVSVAVLKGESRPLSDEEIVSIGRFLNKALMDRSQEPDRPESVPSGLQVPEDGFRIFR